MVDWYDNRSLILVADNMNIIAVTKEGG